MPDLPEYFPSPKRSNPSFKKVLLGVVVFIFFALLADRVGGMVLERLVMMSDLRFSKLYRGDATAEVLVIGDSRGVNAVYAPEFERLTGKITFNLSYNGLGSMVGCALVLDYLDHNSAPELVIFEITNAVNRYHILKDLKIYAGRSQRISKLLADSYSTLANVCRLSHLYRFNAEMFFRSLYYIGRSDQTWINRRVIAEETVAMLEEKLGQIEGFSEGENYNWKAMVETIRVLEAKGINYCFLISPYLPAYTDHVAGLDDFIESVKDQVGEDVTLLDFSRAVENPKYFADPLHMNLEGNLSYLPGLIQAIEIID